MLVLPKMLGRNDIWSYKKECVCSFVASRCDFRLANRSQRGVAPFEPQRGYAPIELQDTQGRFCPRSTQDNKAIAANPSKNLIP
jgi:hypothetical protein